jgi:phosphoglycolate phosphatase-like HAD superfamily hydrolase
MTKRTSLAVFDLDGTLADVRHRLSFLDARPRDWESFFRAAPNDPPLAEGVALAREVALDSELAYVTGRPERCRADTVAWLDRHGLPRGTLLMRGANDRRPAYVVKLRLLRRLAEDHSITMVVDDDERVCDAYGKAGFHVVRADWMKSSETLEAAQEKEGRT